MARSRAGRAIAAVASAIAAMAFGPSAAGQRSVSAAFADEPRVFLGQSAELVVYVEGVGENPSLELPADAEGMDLALSSTSRMSFGSTVIVNGRTVREGRQGVRFLVEVTPTRTGVLEVPAIEVMDASGRPAGLATDPVTLRVETPERRDDLLVRLELGVGEAWVGERVPVRVELLVRENARVPSYRFEARGFDGVLAPPGGADAGTPVRARGNALLLGERSSPEPAGAVEIGGERFSRFVVERDAVAVRPGVFEVGPVVFLAEYRPPGFRRSMRVGVPSDTAPLTVNALPDEGRPADFNGLVGSFRVEAETDARAVRVGDPFELRVTLIGDASSAAAIEGADAGDLGVGAALGEGFRVRAVNEPPELSFGEGRPRARFRFLVRAASEGVDEIPGVSVAYFDPERGDYAEARSRPIALEVRAAERVTLDDAPQSGFGGGDGEHRGRVGSPADAEAGLSANMPAAELLEDRSFDLGASVRRPLVIAAIAGPPAAYAVAAVGLALARRRRGVAATREPRAAARHALGILRSAASERDPGERAARAIRAYAAARDGVEASAVSTERFRTLVGEDRPDLANDAEQLLERLDAARYGGSDTERDALGGAAEALFHRIAGGAKRGSP